MQSTRSLHDSAESREYMNAMSLQPGCLFLPRPKYSGRTVNTAKDIFARTTHFLIPPPVAPPKDQIKDILCSRLVKALDTYPSQLQTRK